MAQAGGEANPIPVGQRLEYIDGLRALAALWVLLGHAYYEPGNGYYASRWMTRLALHYGHIAVDVFIALSGFCLMLPLARRGGTLTKGAVGTFFRRRALRILPPYYAALALSIAFILVAAHRPTGTVWDNTLPLTPRSVLAHLFLLHDLPITGKDGNLNYPLWSIAVECQIYLFFPLIALSLARWGNARTLAWTIGAGLALHLLTKGWLADAMPWYLGLFAMGAVAARECARNPARFQEGFRPLLIGLWTLVPVSIALLGRTRILQAYPLFDTLVGVATALLLAVTFADAPSQRYWLTRLLAWPPLAALGVFSYSLYLVHAPLLHAAYLLLTPALHPAPPVMFGLLLLCSPLIVGTSYLFHLAFERPFMRRKP